MLDINRVITVAVSIPFDSRVSAEEIAECILDNRLPASMSGHVRCFMERSSLETFKKFCKRNGVGIRKLHQFFLTHRDEHKLTCPALEAFFEQLKQ